MRKKGRKNKVYSAEFKLMVITQMLKKELSYHETARRFEIGNDRSCGSVIQTIQRWERIYLEEGDAGLMEERRGRSGKGGRPPKELKPEVEEDLIAENQRLRLENAYLKKLHALALEKMKSGNKTKPE